MNVAAVEPLALSRHELISAEDCRELCRRVTGLRDFWRKRGSGFYSLGTASYLDAPGRHPAYLASAAKTNPVIRANFDDVLDVVRGFFEELLDEPVRVSEELAAPGFHIFELDGSLRTDDRPHKRAHFDLQWMDALPDRAITGTVSFTVLVEQPSGGAAMEVWPLRYPPANGITATVQEYAESHPSRRLGYSDGGMIVHDGHVLHAIGTSEDPAPRGRRITLQGHGARTDGTWQLYW